MPHARGEELQRLVERRRHLRRHPAQYLVACELAARPGLRLPPRHLPLVDTRLFLSEQCLERRRHRRDAAARARRVVELRQLRRRRRRRRRRRLRPLLLLLESNIWRRRLGRRRRVVARAAGAAAAAEELAEEAGLGRGLRRGRRVGGRRHGGEEGWDRHRRHAGEEHIERGRRVAVDRGERLAHVAEGEAGAHELADDGLAPLGRLVVVGLVRPEELAEQPAQCGALGAGEAGGGGVLLGGGGRRRRGAALGALGLGEVLVEQLGVRL